jgi:hypothetical protein
MVATNNKKTTTDLTDPTAAWGDELVETLGGMEVVDKPVLLGVTHKITGYKFTYNETRQISYVWCEFETTPGGDKKVYNDSSAQGIRFQMEEFHEKKHPGEPFELDKWYDTALLAPQGLRYSEFPAKDNRGKDVTGRAFYLTLQNTGRQ